MLSERAQQFRKHAIHETILRVGTFLESVEASEAPEIAEARDRFKTVDRYVERVVKGLDPDLTSFTLLDALVQHLDGIQGDLGGYLANRANSQALVSAHANADATIDVCSRIGSLRLASQGQALADLGSSLRERAEIALSQVESRALELQDRLAELGSSLDSSKAKQDELRGQLEQEKGRVDSVVGDLQRQFSEAEDRRRQSHDDQLKALQQEGSDLVKKQEQEFAATTAKADASADDFLNRLQGKETEATTLVGIIGNTGVTGHYSTAAEAEMRQANTFRWIALITMFAIVVGVGLTIWAALGQQAWQEVVLRIGITIALAIPAGYTAREAEHHRVLERHYRRMELELASIDSYLAKVEPDQRTKLKADLATRYFGQSPAPQGPMPADKVALTSLDLIRTLVDNLVKR